jgi:hypothetical protein
MHKRYTRIKIGTISHERCHVEEEIWKEIEEQQLSKEKERQRFTDRQPT